MLLFDDCPHPPRPPATHFLLHLPHEKDSDCDGSLRRECVWGGADGQDGADGQYLHRQGL